MIETLPEALIKAASSSPLCGIRFYDRKIGEQWYSYSHIYHDAYNLAALFRDHGIRENQVIALVMPTSYQLVVCLFALYYVKAIPTILTTPRLARVGNYEQYIASLIQSASIVSILTESTWQGKMLSCVKAAKTDTTVVATDSLFPITTANQSQFSFCPSGYSADALALVQFSSGTTSNPRPIALRHSNIIANCQAIIDTFPGELSSHSGVSWLPLHHDMGLIGNLFSALVAGANLSLIRPEDFVAQPLMWLEILSKHRGTISPAPNFALDLCCQRIPDAKIANLDLSHWQLALIGAEMVRKNSLDQFFEKFSLAGFRYQSFTPVYGLAEATLAVSFSSVTQPPLFGSFDRKQLSQGIAQNSPNQADQLKSNDTINLASVGTALTGISIRIVDTNDNEIESSQIGSIQVRGPSIMAGYLNPDQSLKQDISRQGWLDTGDLGFWFGIPHQLYITGRKKDILIVNGRNIDANLVESCCMDILGQAWGIVAVPDLYDEKKSEGFSIVAVLPRNMKEQNTKDFSEINQANDRANPLQTLTLSIRSILTKSLQLNPISVFIVLPGQIPRTTSGKIKRMALSHLINHPDFSPLFKDNGASNETIF